jgi:two-component system, cell cycle sensor histidine kinase and response regulator CckA
MSDKPSYEELVIKIARLEQEALTDQKLLKTAQLQEESLKESEKRYQTMFEQAAVGMVHCAPDGRYLMINNRFAEFVGYSRDELLGLSFMSITFPEDIPADLAGINRLLSGESRLFSRDKRYVRKDGAIVWAHLTASLMVDESGKPDFFIVFIDDISQRKLAEEVIERRLLSLTQPLEDPSSVVFEDLFNLDDIQRLQDEFARATRISSIITRADGTPVTRPSNFTRLCNDIIRKTDKGLAKCLKSDAALGRLSTESPIIMPCQSGGLWMAGAGISVGGHHVANWLIGQVRDETQTEEMMCRYAREIGANEEEVAHAFLEVPAMSREHFEEIARALFTLTNLLSSSTYQNILQARYIAEAKEVQEKLRKSENRLRFALEGANDGLWDVHLPTGTVYLSPRSFEILGYSADEIDNVIKDWHALVHPDDLTLTRKRFAAHFKGQTPALMMEHRLRMKSGGWKWLLTRGKVVEWGENGQALRVVGTHTDISERKKIEQTQMFLLECDRFPSGEDVFKSLARYLAEVLEMDGVCINRLEKDNLSACMVANYCDGHFEDNLTYTLKDTPCGDAVGKAICSYVKDVRHLFPADAMLQEMVAESYVGTTLWDSKGTVIGLIAAIGRRPLANPQRAESILKLVAIRAAGELERRDAEAEKAMLQSQLIQAQKMESIGRLAGGVAHDFNNMLSVILGHVELAEAQANPGDLLLEDLKEIKMAARRSADLTTQLLAFARKQTISPRILDLNETVECLFKMLRRLIGEDIDLAWKPGKDLWQVNIDPTQVDQILANLMVNARDAIDGAGKITIETDNAVLDEEYCSGHADFVPGNYVMLSVSDDGCGMDQKIQGHIFEPFFTTKGVGEGTGLGLATIYGIVKQNSGFIYVYSEPGQGTTFRIYLPKHVGKASKIEKMPEMVQLGKETILLVEDEPSIMHLGKLLLEGLGYRVLAASTPGEALRLGEQNSGEIHLLLTDVVMPEMNGRDLARRLLSLYPNIKRLFMSGYTANVIAHHGVLDEGVHFIQKPFSRAELSSKVRAALQEKI